MSRANLCKRSGFGGRRMTLALLAGLRAGMLLLVIASVAGAAPGALEIDEETARIIDEVFADLDGTHSPGCAIGIMDRGVLVHQRGYGMASLEHRVPIDENTVFYTGSVSKQFAAAAVAMAARERHLSLDDDIRKWFPEIPDYGDTITVRHLVHHTSGLRDYLGLMALAGVPFENVTSRDWVLELIARQKAPNFAPGEQYLYSNSGYFLMAQLIGRATGRSLREYSHEKFFAPLRMRNTHFHDDRTEVVANRALAYSASEDGFVVNWSPAFDQVGSGGLLSTIEDLARWDESFYTDSLDRLNKLDSPDSPGAGFWKSLQERGRLRDGEELDYAFGLTIDEYQGRPRIQHGGAMFGYRAQLTRFPEDELGIAVLCNLASADPGGRASRIADRLLNVIPEDASSGETDDSGEGHIAVVELSPEQLDQWVGDYELFPGVPLQISRQGTGLLAIPPDDEAFPLSPTSATRFMIDDPPLPLTSTSAVFEKDGDSRLLRVELFGRETSAPALARRIEDADELRSWVGSFWSEELAATATLELEDGRLTYRVGSLEPRDLIVRVNGNASLPGLRLEGETTDSDDIAAFVIDAGRVRGIRFERRLSDER